MIKFIHCSDFHFGIYKYGRLNPKTGLNTRFEEDVKQLDKIIKYAIKNHYKYFFITGDVFDKRNPQSIVRREFAKRLRRLMKAKIHTVVLMGNHDNVKAFDKEHCLAGEKILANRYLHIVNRWRDIDFEEDELTIACMPSDQVRRKFNHCIHTNIIVLGHFTIKGAKQGNHIFDSFVNLDTSYFINKRIKYVAMGHMHQYQVLGKAVYSGSINRINFNDTDVQKGFVGGRIKNKKCTWKFIKLSSRQFNEIDCQWGEGIKKKLEHTKVKNRIVKLNISVKKNEVYIPVMKIKRFLYSRGAIVDSVNIIRQYKKHIRDKKYKYSIDPQKMLKYHLRKEGKSVIKKGIDILAEAQS